MIFVLLQKDMITELKQSQSATQDKVMKELEAVKQQLK
jgi:hypothetical protein